MREFDLNIERVLENWTVAHALREVIANALDQQALTETRDRRAESGRTGLVEPEKVASQPHQAGHRSADRAGEDPGSGRCSTGPASSTASWPKPGLTLVTSTIEGR